ncbi:MAG: hypothetical protein LBM64_09980 [Deltaproteobacteria bacterium]|jgi:hypothetical protein|nr:hypothetical protein [Deltaproteobacteria bacterium]
MMRGGSIVDATIINILSPADRKALGEMLMPADLLRTVVQRQLILDGLRQANWRHFARLRQ